jgi:ankyrin repeat protein
MAFQNGHVDIIDFLLENGAYSKLGGIYSNDPLHVALYYKQLEACKIILENQQVSNQNTRRSTKIENYFAN